MKSQAAGRELSLAETGEAEQQRPEEAPELHQPGQEQTESGASTGTATELRKALCSLPKALVDLTGFPYVPGQNPLLPED